MRDACFLRIRGNKGVAVPRSLAFHQCSRVQGVVRSLSYSNKFSSKYYGFRLSSRINIYKFQFDQGESDEEPQIACATTESLYFNPQRGTTLTVPRVNYHYKRVSFEQLKIVKKSCF